jgi:hypothetical protein
MEWFDFKKQFTEDQEIALWQYFIDHSNIEPNGYHRIGFHVKDMDDFWKRVFARYSGDFKRYEILRKEYKAETFQMIKSQAIKGNIWDKRETFLENSLLRYLWRFIKWYLKRKCAL